MISMDTITPTLLSLYKMAEQFTTKSAYHSLTMAAISLSEACSFFFPELRSVVWKRIWDCLMVASQEKVVQVNIAETALHSLQLMCSQMVDAIAVCSSHVKELLQKPATSEGLLEYSSNHLTRLGKRRKERRVASKYGM